MKFFKKAEFILPSCVLLFGLVWVVFSEAINMPNYLTPAVFTNPDTYQDALFVFAVSALLFIILRNHRLKYLQSEKEIRKLSLVAENAGNGVIILDRQGRIEWVNEAFTTLSGYSLQDVSGKLPREVLHGKETDPKTANELALHAAEGKPISRQIINYNKDGKPHWTQVNISPIISGGQLEYTVSVHTDISQLKLNEQKIEFQNKQLKEIAFKTSHLLRAPLANIMGLTSVIKANGCKNDKNEELLELLEVSAVQLDGVIKEIVTQTTQLSNLVPSGKS